jgi:diguanylate cyclase (GGDEF)-like protein
VASELLLPILILALAAPGVLLLIRSFRHSRELERKSRELTALRAEVRAANEKLEQRAESLHRILRSSAELKAHLPIGAVLENVVRAASTGLGCPRVLLSLRDRANGTLVPRAHVGLAEEWPSLAALRLPADRLVGTAGTECLTPLASLRPESGRSGLEIVPLVAVDRLVGLLELEGANRSDADPEERKAVLELFGDQAVTAVRLARAYETTRLGSLRDSLTGIANHGHFQETLYRELTRHERNGARLVLLIADLDDFKGVNDRYGHPAGDAVLKAAVASLLESVRDMDTVARYGGEEFAIILPETDAENGLRVAERLRASIAGTPFQTGLPEPLHLTVSIGLAVFPDDAVRKGGLIECADQALYAAKKTGKDRVARFTKVPATADSLHTGRE